MKNNPSPIKNLNSLYLKVFLSLTVLMLAGYSNADGLIPEWKKITYHTVCEKVGKRHCVAGFGFTVFSDGSFQIGPGPGNDPRLGALAKDEFKIIQNDLNNLIASGRDSKSCSPGDSIEGERDLINLTLNDGTSVEVYRSETYPNVCYRGEPSMSQKLHSDLKLLVVKYYTVPFP